MARRNPARRRLVGSLSACAILLAVGTSAIAQEPSASVGPDQAAPPRIGATVRPSKLTFPAEGTVQTTIRNAGSIPAAVWAVVNLPGTRLPAVGWAVTVDPALVQPDEWSTVTLTIDGAWLGDVSLDVFLVPELQGQEAMVLRFPIPVDVEGATTESAAAAWGAALAHRMTQVMAPFGTAGG